MTPSNFRYTTVKLFVLHLTVKIRVVFTLHLGGFSELIKALCWGLWLDCVGEFAIFRKNCCNCPRLRK